VDRGGRHRGRAVSGAGGDRRGRSAGVPGGCPRSAPPGAAAGPPRRGGPRDRPGGAVGHLQGRLVVRAVPDRGGGTVPAAVRPTPRQSGGGRGRQGRRPRGPAAAAGRSGHDCVGDRWGPAYGGGDPLRSPVAAAGGAPGPAAFARAHPQPGGAPGSGVGRPGGGGPPTATWVRCGGGAARATGRGGVVISATGLELRAGSRILLSGATLRVQPGDRIGLVGPNGAGKTSTLRVLAGEAAPYAGRVERRGAVGYLPQDPRTGDLTGLARDRVLSARGLDRLLAEMRELEQRLAVAADD